MNGVSDPGPEKQVPVPVDSRGRGMSACRQNGVGGESSLGYKGTRLPGKKNKCYARETALRGASIEDVKRNKVIQQHNAETKRYQREKAVVAYSEGRKCWRVGIQVPFDKVSERVTESQPTRGLARSTIPSPDRDKFSTEVMSVDESGPMFSCGSGTLT